MHVSPRRAFLVSGRHCKYRNVKVFVAGVVHTEYDTCLPKISVYVVRIWERLRRVDHFLVLDNRECIYGSAVRRYSVLPSNLLRHVNTSSSVFVFFGLLHGSSRPRRRRFSRDVVYRDVSRRVFKFAVTDSYTTTTCLCVALYCLLVVFVLARYPVCMVLLPGYTTESYSGCRWS